MTRRPTTVLVMSQPTLEQLFTRSRIERLRRVAALSSPICLTELETAASRDRLREVEVMVTSWGAPVLTGAILDHAPELRAVFHAAGTIKPHLADRACWDRGILVTSAAAANAVPVAEYTLAAILQAGKRVGEAAAAFRQHAGTIGPWLDKLPHGSNYHRTVGIVSLSHIGRRVASLLRGFDFNVLVHDPYASVEEARRLGATLVDLTELLRRSDIVSLHAPSLPETRDLLDAERLALLPDHATVINTARGSLIDTPALTAECLSGRLSAVLDVTNPEPLPADSPLYHLPNVQLTPHIAGARGSEVLRLADAAIDELERYAAGLQPLRPVYMNDLARIA